MSVKFTNMMSMNQLVSDVVVIGGGIVGLATALAVQKRWPDASVVVVEAERHVAAHQSGHNSGVLHSGVYYKPGSQKAILCRTGKAAMEAFCEEQSIEWNRIGKVVVATRENELAGLNAIADRAVANGVSFERIDTDGLREIEPAVGGIAALHVPGTGIVDYADVCRTMAKIIEQRGGKIVFDFDVVAIDSQPSHLMITSRSGDAITCERLISCGGLQSDRVFRLAGGQSPVRIVPFRGEYYELTSQSESLCRGLIYPVPDPSFPFLGVHFTRMIDGGVECGPNAVLALSRTGYRWTEINMHDLAETLSFRGFRTLARKHWRMGAGEVHRSLSKAAFVTALQKLIPSIKADDLKPGRAGVRAQAVTPDGNLVDDFWFESTDRAIHVLNAPSPAATASLAIGEEIAERFGQAVSTR
ncbi:L-2-hydroxyglutarate oxidase [Rubripirellula amarantea]|nr:L-2-hydroxyglutarate oxidase [Rubripirellula amarantea]